MTTTVLHAALARFLVLAVPHRARAEARRLKTSTDPRRRIRAYAIPIAWQAAAALLLISSAEPELRAEG